MTVARFKSLKENLLKFENRGGEIIGNPRSISCPKWLNKNVEVKAEWNRVSKILLSENKDFTSKDLKALEAYCVNYSHWKKAEEIVMEKGFTFETPNGYIQQRPEVSIANKAQDKMLAMAKELGLTTASRARINKGIPVKMEEDLDTELDGMISGSG